MVEPHELFDSNNIQFKKDDKHKHRELITFLKSGRYAATLSTPVSRGRFLYNLREHTKDAPIENLIVGLGINVNRGTEIYQIRHVTGDENSVGIPAELINEINRWVRDNDVPGVVSFHNHPPGGWDDVVRRPYPSDTDREVALVHNLQGQLAAAATNAAIKVIFGRTVNPVIKKYRVKRIHHYVGYGKQLREYRHFYQGLYSLFIKSRQ